LETNSSGSGNRRVIFHGGRQAHKQLDIAIREEFNRQAELYRKNIKKYNRKKLKFDES
jgi:hypothetical protein